MKVDSLHLNVGAGMIVGARITIPAVVVAVIGWLMTPHLRSIGWLGPNDPFRKIGFMVALGTILGAAIVDLLLIAYQAWNAGAKNTWCRRPEDWKKVNQWLLLSWSLFGRVATSDRRLASFGTSRLVLCFSQLGSFFVRDDQRDFARDFG